jgi:hypothetical protein
LHGVTPIAIVGLNHTIPLWHKCGRFVAVQSRNITVPWGRFERFNGVASDLAGLND